MRDRVAEIDRAQDSLCTQLARAVATIEELEQGRDAAYLERNRVVALLAALFPSVRTRTAIEGWDPEWHNCVFVQLPTGQASWHYHDREAELFDHVRERDPLELTRAPIWDGHTTEQKYLRVQTLASIAAEDNWADMLPKGIGIRS